MIIKVFRGGVLGELLDRHIRRMTQRAVRRRRLEVATTSISMIIALVFDQLDRFVAIAPDAVSEFVILARAVRRRVQLAISDLVLNFEIKIDTNVWKKSIFEACN